MDDTKKKSLKKDNKLGGEKKRLVADKVKKIFLELLYHQKSSWF